MVATDKTHKEMVELKALADNIPFRVITLPEFSRPDYEPESIRQTRTYTQLQPGMQAIQRFLLERGAVELLTSEQTQALFVEMHWCGYRIHEASCKTYTKASARREALVSARRLISRMEAAEEELFVANRRLIVNCAKPFFWIGQVWISDFLQEGSRALSNAIRKFDFQRGTPFYAYAQQSVLNRLRNYARNHARSGHMGLRPTGEMTDMIEAIARYREDNGEEPDNALLAQLTGLPENRVAKLRPHVKQWENTPLPPLSLDQLMGETDVNLYEVLGRGSQESGAFAAEKAEIWQAIERLPERSKRIMEMRFLEGHTLEETGAALNLTRARIKQIEDRTVQKIKQWLKQDS